MNCGAFFVLTSCNNVYFDLRLSNFYFAYLKQIGFVIIVGETWVCKINAQQMAHIAHSQCSIEELRKLFNKITGNSLGNRKKCSEANVKALLSLSEIRTDAIPAIG